MFSGKPYLVYLPASVQCSDFCLTKIIHIPDQKYRFLWCRQFFCESIFQVKNIFCVSTMPRVKYGFTKKWPTPEKPIFFVWNVNYSGETKITALNRCWQINKVKFTTKHNNLLQYQQIYFVLILMPDIVEQIL